MDIDKREKIKLATIIGCFLLAIIIFGIQCSGGNGKEQTISTEVQLL